MHAVRAHRRITSWIAALALLLASLVPALSHALATGTSSIDSMEVCTSQGSKWVQTGDEDAQPAPSSALSLEHCFYCSLHAPALGLPPLIEAALIPQPLSQPLPQAFFSAQRTLHAWVSAQPRAPPLFS